MNEQLDESIAEWIRDRVRKEVNSQLRRGAMARTREDFINRLVEVLIPALAHHYRVMLGALNNRTDQLAKWQEHEEDFLDQFADRMFERPKAKGLDRRQAAEKALDEVMDQDAARRRRETSKFTATYQLKKVASLPKDAHEEFLGRVRAIVEEMFPADE
jgi:hypothetical protein